MQRVYLDYNREQQRLRLTKGLAFINEQLPKVSKNVAQVEGTLEEFRKNQNLIEPEVQAKALTEAINNIQRNCSPQQSCGMGKRAYIFRSSNIGLMKIS
ncbi:hypothetical protein [Microcoleus vaginatus]|uniref:hypothetical protein n=1 Tax=Microcoleus vaginatus TaxID=119532 RepID=UPI0032A413B5